MTIFITTLIHYSSVSLNIPHNLISLGVAESNLRPFTPAAANTLHSFTYSLPFNRLAS